MRKQRLHKVLFLLLGLVCLGLVAFTSKTAEAANPTTINFQGKVVNANGTNVADGTYSFVFRIYNTSSPTPTTACSSDSACLFEETQGSVSVTSGVFQVELGSSCSGGLVGSNSCTKSVSGGLNFNSNNGLYLTLQFNGDTSGSHGGFMWPVIHLTSVPYAFYADNSGALSGLTASNFVQLAQGLQTDTSTTNASIAVNKNNASGTPDILLLQKTGQNVLEVNNSGTVLLGQAGASGLDGTLTFNNHAGANTVSFSLQANPGSSYTLLLPTTGPSTSQCLQTDSTTANQLKFASCAAGGSGYTTIQDEGSNLTARTTLNFIGNSVVCADNSGSSRTDCTVAPTQQNVYDNSAGSTTPEIILNNGGTNTGGIDIQNNNGSPVSGSLFAIRDKAASGLGTAMFSVDNNGLISIQPAASLTSGQTNVSQTLTNASSTGGTVQGYSQTITVSNTSSASTTNGINIAITDATTLANITNGVNATVTDNGASGAKTNKAVTGTAGGSNSSAINYGGYFSIGGGSSTSAALFATNGTSNGNILQLQKSTSDVLVVANGGTLESLSGKNGLSSPTNVSFSAPCSPSGALTFGGVYKYKVTSLNASSNETVPYAEITATAASSCPASNFPIISLSWSSTGAASYDVYRTAVGGASNTETFLANTGSASYSDLGTVSPGSVGPPVADATTGLFSNGSLTLQPASSLLSGQSDFMQLLTNASSSGGTVQGYSQTITISNTSSASTTNGVNISLSDATTIGNTTNGVSISLTNTGAATKTQSGVNATVTDNASSSGSTNVAVKASVAGSNASQIQYGIDSSANHGVAIRGASTGTGGSITCGPTTAADSIGVCGTTTQASSAGFGGYFAATGNGGTALFATNGTSTANIFQLQDGTSPTNVFTVADGGLITLQPAADLTGSTAHITETYIVDSGNSIGLKETITNNGFLSATSATGVSIAVDDSNGNGPSNLNTGVTVSLTGSNANQKQVGVDASVNAGISLRGASTGSSGASGVKCGPTTSSLSIGVCGYTTLANSSAYGGFFAAQGNGGTALFATNSTSTANIFQLQDGTTPTNVLTVADVGLITLQPAANLTSGQTNVTQTLTNGSSTGGTVQGYSQAITISNTSSASTTNGIKIGLTDATSLANTDIGLSVDLSGITNSAATKTAALFNGGSVLQTTNGPVYQSGVDATSTVGSGTGNEIVKQVYTVGKYAYLVKAGDATTCAGSSGSFIGCELQIYDVSKPTAPKYLGGADSSGATNTGTGSTTFNTVFVVGRYAYVGTNGDLTDACGTTTPSGCELMVFDVSNPTSPVYKGGVDSSGTTNSGTGFGTYNNIYVSGRYAYVAKNASNSNCNTNPGGCELNVFDISNPIAPKFIGGADNSGSTNNGTDSSEGFLSVFVSGKYAYTTDTVQTLSQSCTGSAGSAKGCQLKVWDISNPAAPTYLGGGTSFGETNTGSSVTGVDMNSIYVSGRYAYTVNSTNSDSCVVSSGSADGCQFKVWDISNPTSPTLVSGLNADGTSTGSVLDNFTSVTVSGKYAYITQVGDSASACGTANNARGCELKVIDVSDPSRPTYVGGADDGGGTNSGSNSRGMNNIYIAGRYAYVAANGSATACSNTPGSGIGCEFQIYDITGLDATSVTAGSLQAGTLQVQNAGIFNDMLSVGGGLVVGSGAQISGDLGVAGTLALQPLTSLTSGQNGITQVLTNASSTGGTVQGYSQTITVSNTSSASTTNGINIAITDATTLANTTNGVNATVTDNGASGAKTNSAVLAIANGTNTSQLQYALNAQANHGVAVIGSSTGTGGSVTCGPTTAANSIGVCGTTSTASSAGFGGYFAATGNGGTAIFATNGTSTSSILVLQDGTTPTNVFTVADGGQATHTVPAFNASAFVIQDSGSVAYLTADTSQTRVVIGSATADATAIVLQVDSYNGSFTPNTTPGSGPEASGVCSTTADQGGLYYSTTSNAIRACINGGWEDLVSTAGLGIISFGVVADSGNQPGDLPSLQTTGATGPCKVHWQSTTSVRVEPCTAYSGGRKVVVSQTDLTLTTTTTNLFENVCLTGTNGAPALVGPAATQTSATIEPTFSINNPILCLATLKNSSTVNGNFTGTVQGQIYDTRTFTQTTKEFETSAAAMGLGYVAQTSTSGVGLATATAGTGLQRGVIVATNGAAASGNVPNVIIATSGPAYVVATAGSTGAQVETGGTTSSFAITGASANAYGSLGISRTAFVSTCTSAATCLGSLYLVLDIR